MSDYESAKEIAEAVDGVGNAVGELIELLRDDDVIPTLRDRFAMAALQGILSGRHNFRKEIFPLEEVAAAAYETADEMLKEREKKVK